MKKKILFTVIPIIAIISAIIAVLCTVFTSKEPASTNTLFSFVEKEGDLLTSLTEKQLFFKVNSSAAAEIEASFNLEGKGEPTEEQKIKLQSKVDGFQNYFQFSFDRKEHIYSVKNLKINHNGKAVLGYDKEIIIPKLINQNPTPEPNPDPDITEPVVPPKPSISKINMILNQSSDITKILLSFYNGNNAVKEYDELSLKLTTPGTTEIVENKKLFSEKIVSFEDGVLIIDKTKLKPNNNAEKYLLEVTIQKGNLIGSGNFSFSVSENIFISNPSINCIEDVLYLGQKHATFCVNMPYNEYVTINDLIVNNTTITNFTEKINGQKRELYFEYNFNIAKNIENVVLNSIEYSTDTFTKRYASGKTAKVSFRNPNFVPTLELNKNYYKLGENIILSLKLESDYYINDLIVTGLELNGKKYDLTHNVVSTNPIIIDNLTADENGKIELTKIYYKSFDLESSDDLNKIVTYNILSIPKMVSATESIMINSDSTNVDIVFDKPINKFKNFDFDIRVTGLIPLDKTNFSLLNEKTIRLNLSEFLTSSKQLTIIINFISADFIDSENKTTKIQLIENEKLDVLYSQEVFTFNQFSTETQNTDLITFKTVQIDKNINIEKFKIFYNLYKDGVKVDSFSEAIAEKTNDGKYCFFLQNTPAEGYNSIEILDATAYTDDGKIIRLNQLNCIKVIISVTKY